MCTLKSRTCLRCDYFLTTYRMKVWFRNKPGRILPYGWSLSIRICVHIRLHLYATYIYV